jgi:spoIIIJ-associated protein
MEDAKKVNKDKLSEIEVEGKTTQEAVQKAIDILKVPKSKIRIQILSEEEKGLFGMPGSKLAKIRATIKNKNNLKDG